MLVEIIVPCDNHDHAQRVQTILAIPYPQQELRVTSMSAHSWGVYAKVDLDELAQFGTEVESALEQARK